MSPKRATMHTLRIIIGVVVIATSMLGCGKRFVRASEKEFLADQVMIFDNDPHDTASTEHVRTNREGAAGGHGAGGGGCGCN